jgi:hypothetical protein
MIGVAMEGKLYMAVLYNDEGKRAGFEVRGDLETIMERYPEGVSPLGRKVKFFECVEITAKEVKIVKE